MSLCVFGRQLLITCLLNLFSYAVYAEEMRMAVTTSFHNSGLSDVLLPRIKADLDIDIQLLVVGTGQALKLGRSGDVDALLVHSKSAEEEFVAQGHATHRREVMYNDFVLIGPASDPAKVVGSNSVGQALLKIAASGSASESVFVSRGDDSGTHRKERSLWRSSGLDPETFQSGWYRSVGAGMGAALNTATGMDAYLLADRASWLKFLNKGTLKLLFAGDSVLFNQYAYLPISAKAHPHVKMHASRVVENWLVSERGQDLIGGYAIEGHSLFTPNAHPN